MNPPHRYLRDLLQTARQLGGVVGVLLILLSIPGIIALLTPGDHATRVLSCLAVGVAVVSGLLCALGVSLLWYGLRGALRFRAPARIRIRRR